MYTGITQEWKSGIKQVWIITLNFNFYAND